MGVTKEQFYDGVVRYLDSYVIPKLPTQGKWLIGTAAALYNPDGLLETIRTNPVCKAMGVISEEGLIDIDRAAVAIKESANKYGSLPVNIPLVGVLTFSAEDVEKLRNCINGGA